MLYILNTEKSTGKANRNDYRNSIHILYTFYAVETSVQGAYMFNNLELFVAKPGQTFNNEYVRTQFGRLFFSLF